MHGLGRTPITCTDSRGSIVNWLLIPFLDDAVRLHEGDTPAKRSTSCCAPVPAP